jgi:uncharacterized protein (TIGR02391 family)
MQMPAPWPTPEEAVDLPVDVLAMHVLWRLVDEGSQKYARRNLLLTEAEQAGSDSLLRTRVQHAYAEAWDWLTTHDLLSPLPTQETWSFVTRRGIEVAQTKAGLVALRAGQRLAVDLHPRIEEAVGSEWLLGRFEMAAFAAMRAVEIRVREASGGGVSDLGVNLMKRAFGNDGPLTDSSADPGEQQAMMALFWGAIGMFKNPSSHREVDLDDPTEASEIVLLADLLMRIIERRPAS